MEPPTATSWKSRHTSPARAVSRGENAERGSTTSTAYIAPASSSPRRGQHPLHAERRVLAL
ncbi:MAG: hypothetical protein M5U28_48645 [Sandaracinaceae bacterium]|nr:hypothetical protein [Sandaracinaceae bacterium]